MKLYIKANNLNILKNYQNLITSNLSKTLPLSLENMPIEYISNIKSAKEIEHLKKQLFFDNRELRKIIKGVYFGNSSCEHLLPSLLDISKAKAMFDDKYHNFVFVFPPISENKKDEATDILKELQKTSQEIVVNDFGMLKRVLDVGCKPILGINFTKTIKNAFIDNITPSELNTKQLDNQKKLLKSLEFELEDVRKYYKSLGIGRFSVENIEYDFEFLKQTPLMNVDIYYPFITISNSRACDIAGIFDDKRRYFAHKECHKLCNKVSLEFEHSKIFGLYQRYNSIFKTDIKLKIPQTIYKNSKNRLIWEIFL